MADTSQLTTVDVWRTTLGLLPVPLRAGTDSKDRYVLLNGSSGNFCLDLVGGVDRNSQCSAAWSCDVGHYVTCVGDSIVVNRSDKQAPEETYSCRSVLAQVHEFHQYLERAAPDRSRSIVAHVLRVFRQIRAAFNEQASGAGSLRILLHLLASVASGQYQIVESDFPVWGLSAEISGYSQTLPDASWRPLYNDLSGMGRYPILHPDFELVLSHALGAIFQEAHLEVELSPSYWLPGFEGPANVSPRAIPADTGIYFTPAALARTLAEEATKGIQNLPHRSLLLFDPACGSGELLKECLRLLKLQQYPGHLRVIGWDKSPASVDMARFVLAWERRAWPAGQVEVVVTQQDSLAASSWPNSVNILIMNPPFKAWGLMEHQEREAVTQILGHSNKPNLAMAFARRAVDVVHDGGVLAMITPNSLFEASSGRHVREALAEILTPQLIARLGDQTIFHRALVDAGIFVGTRRPVQAIPTAILWADSRPNSLNRALRGLRRWRGAEIEPLTDDGFSVYSREEVGKTGGPWVARAYEAWATYQRIQSTKRTTPAKKVFDIKQGVRLGSDVFIINKQYVSRLPKSERRFFRPAVMNISISDASLSDSHYVFYPYTPGLPTVTSEQDLERNVPTYYKELLLPAKTKLSSHRSLSKANLNWWELLWARSWQMERTPKIVSKYFGGSRSFAFDQSGEFVVVVGNAWLLKKGAIQLAITDEEISFAFLAYLSSAAASDLIKYVSIQVSGGQWDLSNKYLGDLPIPNLPRLDRAQVSELVETGIKISQGKVDRWTEVDELVLSILNR